MSNLRGREDRAPPRAIDNGEAERLLNQMEHLKNDYLHLCMEFDRPRREDIHAEFLRANRSFENREMRNLVDRANDLLDDVERRCGMPIGDRNRNRTEREEYDRLVRLHNSARRDLDRLRVRLQARYDRQNTGFVGGLGGQMRRRDDFSGPAQSSQMRPQNAMQAQPRYRSRSPPPSYPSQSSLRQRLNRLSPPPPPPPPPLPQQPPNRPNPQTSRPNHFYNAEDDIRRVRDENTRLRAERNDLRARLEEAREQAEMDNDRFDAWHQAQEAELERAEERIEALEEELRRRGERR